MNRLEFEALKAQFPNRLKCYVRVDEDNNNNHFVLFDSVTRTRTRALKKWTMDELQVALSLNKPLSNLKHFRNDMKILDKYDAWEEL